MKAVLRKNGRVRGEWEAAEDAHGVYGHKIFRLMNDAPYEHLSSSNTNRFNDQNALVGNRYTYMIKSYDFAGNRSVEINLAVVQIPFPVSTDGNVL